MFGFLCSRQLQRLKHRRAHLGFLQQNGFFIVKSFTSVGSLSESNKKPEEEGKHSFAVSYLINSCGLSTKSAILASQRVLFQSPERPDLVLNFFKENGFSNAQISRIVGMLPLILLSHPEKTLLPKIELLRSIRVSSSDLITILSLNPFLFRSSIKKHLIPCYDFLKSVLLVDEKVLTTFKRAPRAFLCDLQRLKHWRTHLGFLQQNGFFVVKSFTSVGSLSESNKKPEEEGKHSFAVSYLINSCGLSTKSAILASQRVLFQSPERPDLVLNFFKENGFSNAQISRIVGMLPLILLSDPEKTLLPKIELLRSIGVSSSEVITILSLNPSLFKSSIKKHLIPCYDFLKSVLLVDEKVLTTFKRAPRSFLFIAVSIYWVLSGQKPIFSVMEHPSLTPRRLYHENVYFSMCVM
ncbi:hypothetical protein FH972_011104 [Carpinus fangiana]|uniref:Uncharacterized protein n=1 Tax=Carpinus fangiana TaxID=176857 RepID=A0A660KSB1_9ROSI|nr:hypothetical protein FH972_011104 [Carpinus fangiana]